jgi:hypothetical protein
MVRAYVPPGKRYEPRQRDVYQTAVSLASENPSGFDLESLARRLDCSRDEAQRWFRWLQSTGDFGSPREA